MRGLLSRSPWISHPLADLVFIFGGLIPAIYAVFFLPADGEENAMLISLAVLFFARAHLLVPIAYLGISKPERLRVSQASPNFWRGFWVVAIVPILLYVLSGVIFTITYEPGGQHVAAFIPIAIMGGIWVFWNGWHFAMQQFGIMQMYRFRSGSTGYRRRKFDFFTCLLFAFAGPTLVLFQSGLQSSFFEFFTGRAVFLDPLIQPVLWLLAIVAAGVVIFLVVDGSAKLPLLMMYAAMFLQLYLLSRLPFVFAVLAVSMPHWLQEVFLVGRMIADDRAKAKFKIDQTRDRYFIYFIMTLAALVSLSAIVGTWISRTEAARLNQIQVYGDIKGWSTITPSAYWAAIGIFSLIASVSVLHNYVDRYVHRGRRNF